MTREAIDTTLRRLGLAPTHGRRLVLQHISDCINESESVLRMIQAKAATEECADPDNCGMGAGKWICTRCFVRSMETNSHA